jgi:hypothetical protein
MNPSVTRKKAARLLENKTRKKFARIIARQERALELEKFRPL